MELHSANNDQDDVLDTVPHLPNLQDNQSAIIAAAHYAPPRRISVVAANEEDAVHQFRGNNNPELNNFPAGPIHLRIARSGIPTRIKNGVQQLAKHAPRKNIFLTDEDYQHAPALDRRLHQDDHPVWWWNVR